jgi:hypothetical protein
VPGFFSSGRFVRAWARVGREALAQDPQAVPCEELRLGGLVILSRPAVARGDRIGGGPVHHAWLTELERLAGTSAPRSATRHLQPDLTPRTQERAELRRRAHRSHRTTSTRMRGSANSLETGAESPVGNRDKLRDSNDAVTSGMRDNYQSDDCLKSC